MAIQREVPDGDRDVSFLNFECDMTAGAMRCTLRLTTGRPACTLNAIWRNETGTASVTVPGAQA